MNNAYITCNNCHITAKFGTRISHDKPIPQAKQNSEISTDVIHNDVIMSKFKRFHHSASKCFISVVCG